jgi:HSP20 family protein
MRRDDRDDPFDDIFREIERMMDDMMQGGRGGHAQTDPTGFGSQTHVDVHVTDEDVRVIADLPGVKKEDIGVQCDGDRVTITAATDTQEYDEHIDLPTSVDASSGSASYNNGILEIAFDPASDSTSISVE